MASKPPIPISLLLILLFLFFVSKSSSQQTPSTELEKQTLLRIKSDWGNPAALSHWSSSSAATPICTWDGITCSPAGSVTAISLSNTNIPSPIPASICDLTNLSHLDLSFNYLPGPFPISLYNCSSLTYLDISQNLFVGEIPADVYRMPSNLSYFSLSANNFSGDIPASIGQLLAIKTLLLDNNLFNRSFPAELGNLSALETLWLAYNPFAPASIPQEFGNLTNLRYLWMTKCNLIGEIPDFFSNLKALWHLDLAWNSLTGTIPAGIWMAEKLETVYLYSNKLTGEINGTIGAIGLVSIDVSMNQLTGFIPADFGKLSKLQVLEMYYNQLTGGIPASIGLLPALTDLRLFNNNLTGVLPPELGKHSPLWNFEVSINGFSGEIPEGICARRLLTSVAVYGNSLTGAIPASLGDCPMLDNIQLYGNKFSGDIPAGIWSAVNLTTVMVSDNNLTGTLPAKLPWNLTRLEISNNRISGNLPSYASNLVFFNGANNQFSGDFPASLAGSSRLQVLSLGGNQISGEIPTKISTLRNLNLLNLSSNQLTGVIPGSIGSLPSLNSLDLSSNQLSGDVPPEIGNLKLSYLNLSSNQLSGAIPASLQSQAYDESFLSNPNLCSPYPHLNLQSCTNMSKNRRPSSTVLTLVIVFAALGFSGMMALAFLLMRDCRRRKHDSDLASYKLTSFQSLTFNESSILKGLTTGNQIGSGGAGCVYRVAIGGHDGDFVAVKKIWSSRKLEAKLEREFEAEVRILGSIRHANIIKLLCCISSADAKLLVYEYMEKGSLDQWLHHRNKQAAVLDWKTRLRIAVGAAKGLCYMHHDCSPAVVHRDVKSSNILLDSEFDAKIADFGLARMLVKGGGEPETVTAVAGSFGYMAPECSYTKKVNEKVDIYSFGVVLLELTTGRQAHDGGKHGSLVDMAWRHVGEGNGIIDIIDEEIKDPTYLDEIEAVLRLGIFCTGRSASARPSMKEVLQELHRSEHIPIVVVGDKLHKELDGVPILHTKKGSRVTHENDDHDAGDHGLACFV